MGYVFQLRKSVTNYSGRRHSYAVFLSLIKDDAGSTTSVYIPRKLHRVLPERLYGYSLDELREELRNIWRGLAAILKKT